MRHYRGLEFFPFSEIDGFTMLEKQRQTIIDEINRQGDDYILNVNKEVFIGHLVSKFWIDPIEVHRDQLSVSTSEEQIPAERYPSGWNVVQGKSYSRDVIKFHLPFAGDVRLLKVRASTYSMSAPLITVEDGCICFSVTNFNYTPEEIKQKSEGTINSIIAQNDYLTDDLNQFNATVKSTASQAFDTRKQELLSKNNLMAALGVPVRKSPSTPSTFSIPAKRTRAIAIKPKPEVTEKGYKPDPTLDDKIYHQILELIHDVGKEFERLPSLYSNKEEEHLRDHVLFVLEPNFEGSATGETFNKNGKTDVLLRHDGNNAFIAELKFWHGKKSFLDAISQLLGYLTWRDSKAALVIFVKNKNFSQVLETAKEVIGEHENYLDFVSEQNDGWYHYRFHINDDPNREVKLSLMLFHLPKV